MSGSRGPSGTGFILNRQHPPRDVRISFAYNGRVAGSRACVVSFTDLEGITHSVEVAGESLFQAAALGVAELRRCGLTDVCIGPTTRLKVAVKTPATMHEVQFSRLEAWLQATADRPKNRR